MSAKKSILNMLLLTLLAALTTACSSKNQSTYSDPFAYCLAIGTIDVPDDRYTGPEITTEIIDGFIHSAGLELTNQPIEMFEKTTIWRCMDGQVFACNFGANLPCSSKANTDKSPTQAMIDFCASFPGSEFSPMSETGHNKVFSWRCNGTDPAPDEPI